MVTWLTLNYNDESSEVSNAWRYHYATIYRANWIIDNVTDNANISAEVAKSVIAEAKFMRGYCYFNLTRWFDEVPIVLTSRTLDDLYPEKSSNEACWNQAISDLEASLDGLPAPQANFVDGRGNTGVANALLARLYLYRTRPGSSQYWDKVKQYTQAVENLSVYALEDMDDFSRIFTYTQEDTWVKNREVIWAIGFVYGPIYGGTPFIYAKQSNLGARTVMPVGKSPIKLLNDTGDPYLIGNGRTGQSRFAANVELSDIMINYHNLGDKRTSEYLWYPNYEDYALSNGNEPTSVYVKNVVNSDSLYRKAKETNGSAGEYLHFKKYALREFVGTNIWDGGYNHPLMYPLIRFSDVLLMRAEAEYHLGDEATAKSYLKRITDRAGFDVTYTNSFSGQALVDEILQQRRVELAFESLRVPDLIRLDMFKPPHVGTYTGSVAWNEKLKVIPIPSRELDNNSNLIQNSLWK
ncbi:MAG: RagB/SusD family nutrient uptake outer membrane protein [Cyclobacteriaceae bacterium]|nr:RagB/SusD family nutrient uptake outer membrane protein [Cyclobacteriaceae bacterium]